MGNYIYTVGVYFQLLISSHKEMAILLYQGVVRPIRFFSVQPPLCSPCLCGKEKLHVFSITGRPLTVNKHTFTPPALLFLTSCSLLLLEKESPSVYCCRFDLAHAVENTNCLSVRTQFPSTSTAAHATSMLGCLRYLCLW